MPRIKPIKDNMKVNSTVLALWNALIAWEMMTKYNDSAMVKKVNPIGRRERRIDDKGNHEEHSVI
jgi:hypothetical protein